MTSKYGSKKVCTQGGEPTGQIIIRNLDDEVIEGLKLRASLEGKSLAQLMREVAKAAVPLTGEARAALVRRMHAMTSTDLLRTDSTC